MWPTEWWRDEKAAHRSCCNPRGVLSFSFTDTPQRSNKMEVDGETQKIELQASDQDRFRSFYRNLVSGETADVDTVRFFAHKGSGSVRAASRSFSTDPFAAGVIT